MHFLDLTLPTPAELLAADEALLDQAEATGGPGVLLFWEAPRPFVVLGYANQVAQEVHVEACRERGIPILFASGYGATAQKNGGTAPVIDKPYTQDSLLNGLKAAVARRG